jgi:hypothetical protein
MHRRQAVSAAFGSREAVPLPCKTTINADVTLRGTRSSYDSTAIFLLWWSPRYLPSITQRRPPMIEQNLQRWHQHRKGELPGGLDDLLAEDCVFYSPVVFTAQKGKALTKLYLSAAGNTFSEGDKAQAPGQEKSKFHYSKEVFSGNTIVLEFETEIQGKYINGVDIITFNDAGKIVEFKVMVRPLQAVNILHEQMRAMLDKLQS